MSLYRFICQRCAHHYRAPVITIECPTCNRATNAHGLQRIGEMSGA